MRVLAGEAAADTPFTQLCIQQHNLPGVITFEVGHDVGQRGFVVRQPARAPAQLCKAVDAVHGVCRACSVGHLLIGGKNLLRRLFVSLDPDPPGQHRDLRAAGL